VSKNGIQLALQVPDPRTNEYLRPHPVVVKTVPEITQVSPKPPDRTLFLRKLSAQLFIACHYVE